jgi:hypothetical protein
MLEDYHVRRIINGVPEGIDDFIAGASLPLECNMDYMNGGKLRLVPKEMKKYNGDVSS